MCQYLAAFLFTGRRETRVLKNDRAAVGAQLCFRQFRQKKKVLVLTLLGPLSRVGDR